LHVLAFDSDTGAPLWHRQFWATGRTLVHPTSAVAANTPASDGKRIFAFFSSNDLIALDLEGNVQWYRGLAQTHPLAGNDVGMSSSPAVAGDVVVVQSEAHAESFVEAIDTSSGATRWELQRPRQATWCSPVAYRQEVAGREVDAVLLQTLGRIDAYEARSGQPIWSLAADCESIPSAVVADAVYVPASGLQRVEPAKGAREAQITWKEARLQPGSSSPIVYRDHAYIVNSAGVLACGRIGSSVAPWKLRLGGRFWATPVASGNYLYCINAAGTAYVVDLGDATAQANEPPTKGKIVSTNEFGDEVFGSPAVAGNALYVRSHARLWKIAAESTSALRGGEDADSLSDIR
jgi:outer membrane protein assembly factor BamB